MTCHEATPEQWDELVGAIERSNQRLAGAMPTEQDALRQMQAAYERLQQLGWREAIYCPKDGSSFHSIEVGSTGIHRCHYEGSWPDGSWWVEEAGDLWPSRPSLFRPIPAESGAADGEAVVPHHMLSSTDEPSNSVSGKQNNTTKERT